jgi:hypothetical protein
LRPHHPPWIRRLRALARRAGPAYSVRNQADDVSHVIQYETLRKEICAGIRLDSVERDLVTLQVDEL